MATGDARGDARKPAGADGGTLAVDAFSNGGSDAPFATVIRLINELGVEYRLNHYPSFACPFGFTIRGATAPLDQPTSTEGSDTLCPCDTCREGAARSPACTTVDLLCDAPAHRRYPRRGELRRPLERYRRSSGTCLRPMER